MSSGESAAAMGSGDGVSTLGESPPQAVKKTSDEIMHILYTYVLVSFSLTKVPDQWLWYILIQNT